MLTREDDGIQGSPAPATEGIKHLGGVWTFNYQASKMIVFGFYFLLYFMFF